MPGRSERDGATLSTSRRSGRRFVERRNEWDEAARIIGVVAGLADCCAGSRRGFAAPAGVPVPVACVCRTHQFDGVGVFDEDGLPVSVDGDVSDIFGGWTGGGVVIAGAGSGV